MKLNNKGFTLIELIVVMAIFMVIIIITGDAFNTILTQSGKLYKSEESNIEGVVGLEMFRHDLEQAGFGLLDSFDATVPISYKEAGYAPANLYNDAPNKVPRAFVAGEGVPAANDTNSDGGGTYGVLQGTDYLAIKATSVGANDASQKWTYLNYASGGQPANVWPSGNFKSGDKIIMLRRSFKETGYSNQLVYATHDSSNHLLSTQTIYWVGFASSGYVADYSPALPTEIFYLYGLNSTSDVGMPFNRVDYFVARPSDATKIPATCAPNTGMLYRAGVNHEYSNPGGKLKYMPVLDCVADMQVILGWNMTDTGGAVLVDPANPSANNTVLGSGIVDTWSNADGTVVDGPATVAQVHAALGDPGHVRTKLKVVKVYILAQNGRPDPNYASPSPIHVGDQTAASNTRGHNVDIVGNGWQHYRWKLYQLVIKPKNLISNQ